MMYITYKLTIYSLRFQLFVIRLRNRFLRWQIGLVKRDVEKYEKKYSGTRAYEIDAVFDMFEVEGVDLYYKTILDIAALGDNNGIKSFYLHFDNETLEIQANEDGYLMFTLNDLGGSDD